MSETTTPAGDAASPNKSSPPPSPPRPGATLTQAGREPLVAQDIDTLTAQALGWQLPVAGLRDWLQGYAIGSDGKRFVASPANNSVYTKDGWRLRFASWQDETAAQPKPKRIDAARTTASGELEIRIIIDPAA